MKPALYLALLIAQAAFTQQPATPTTQVKSTPPLCVMGDPRESMWAAQSGPKGKPQMSYYEVNDCSWHYGKNPRDANKKSVPIGTGVPTTSGEIPYTLEVSGPTSITPEGHSIFYAPQQGQIVWHADGSYTCPGPEACTVPAAQEIKQHDPVTDWPVITGTVLVANAPMDFEAEVRVSDPVMVHGRKTYTIDFKPGWTCRASRNYVYSGNPMGDEPPTLVTLTCVKSDAAPERKAK